MPTGELADVAPQVLLAHLMVGAVIAPFQHRPEALNSIRVRHSVDILRDGMLHRLVRVGNAIVALVLVGVHGRLRIDVLLDEGMQRPRVGAADHFRGDFVRLPVLDADNRCLADSTPAGVLERLPLLVAHIPALAPDEGLVHLHRPGEADIAVLERLADAVRQVPRILLRDLQVSVQLHTGHALEIGRHLEYGNCPHLVAEVRSLHHSAGLGREELAARAAAESHIGMGGGVLDVVRTAVRALDLIAPPCANEPVLSGLVVWEHPEKVDEGHSFSMVPARCFVCHCLDPNCLLKLRPVYQEWLGKVKFIDCFSGVLRGCVGFDPDLRPAGQELRGCPFHLYRPWLDYLALAVETDMVVPVLAAKIVVCDVHARLENDVAPAFALLE